VNGATLPALRSALLEADPDVVVVSGDLTQRARRREFLAARAYLDTLPQPQILVPGNHDIPLYNIFARWLSPLKGFRQFITEDPAPLFKDSEIAVLGINTARSLTFKNGRLNVEQILGSCQRMSEHSHAGMRILVTHHPFDILDTGHPSDIVGRSTMAVEEFRRCNIDIIMTGHLHASHSGHSGARYAGNSSILFIQAGTATSTRQRGELNAWNLVKIDGNEVLIECFTWSAHSQTFALFHTDRFRRSPDGWAAEGAAVISSVSPN
jgi:3',5'-cyclic AMP phosphodiesterase CpdA